MKQQFNVSLDPDLIRRIKHRSIDAQLSLSDLMTRVLEAHLTVEEHPMTEPTSSTPGAAGSLQLQPMVHVEQMSAAVDFYERLGGEVVHGSRDGDWVLMRIGGAEVGLLAHPPNPEQQEGVVELNFAFSGALADLEQQLRVAGVRVARPTSDEGFGRQLQVSSPDGLLVKINELEPDLYT